MKRKNWIQRNIEYVKTINRCNLTDSMSFLDQILTLKKGLTSKLYIWNWIRGKDFYKICAQYVITRTKKIMNGIFADDDEMVEIMTRINLLITEIMKSEPNYEVRKSFVWNVTKQVPLLRVDMLPYISSERVKHILMKEKLVLNDEALSPIIDAIHDLRDQVNSVDTIIDDTIHTFTEG